MPLEIESIERSPIRLGATFSTHRDPRYETAFANGRSSENNRLAAIKYVYPPKNC